MILAALSLAVAFNRPALENRTSFDAACRRVLHALYKQDWRALVRDSDDQIGFDQYVRIYLFPNGERTTKYDEVVVDALFSRKAIDTDIPPPAALTTALVDTTRPLSRSAREAFREFCGYVRTSVDTPPFTPQWGLHEAGAEQETLYGPAIYGKVASNFYWRVEMHRNTGRWRASRLIIEMH